MLGGTPSVFTIHNLAYQGLFEPDWLPRLDLPWDLLSLGRLEFWGKISFLKGGINDADAITTVSPKYAEEIQTPEFGFGFDGILRSARPISSASSTASTRSNGIRRAIRSCRPITATSDLAGKRLDKAELLTRYRPGRRRRVARRPLIGMISRMVDQKGLDLIAALARSSPTLDATLIVLGTGEARYQDLWRELAARHPDASACTSDSTRGSRISSRRAPTCFSCRRASSRAA